MEYIAHRGASFEAPENSLEALELAIAQGAERVEFDIQITKDGVPVVMHDLTTERTTDANHEIEFTNAEELAFVHLDNGEPVPTLESWCAHAAGRIALDAELKATTDEVAAKVLEIIDRYGLLDDALLTSFDGTVLRRIRQLGFQGRSGLIVGSPALNVRQRLYEMWPLDAIAAAQATELVIHHRLAHTMLRKAVARAGIGLYYWTAMDDERREPERRAALYRRMARTRPKGIIVGRVTEARQTIEGTASDH